MSKSTVLSFTITVTDSHVSACYQGKPYFTMNSFQPDEALMLKQSRLVQCHPLRDTTFEGIYFIDLKNNTIKQCQKENDVPDNFPLYRNWILNNHVQYDKEKGLVYV
jgi:hypothetical protein